MRQRGDVVIQGLRKRGKTCILGICVTYTGAKAYKGLSLSSVLEAAVWVKKAKYLKACLEQRDIFVPLAYSVDRMAGVEACTFEKRITAILADK